ncbi:MAG: hypothetical protein R2877_03870 [Bdellovibrionota bacterium]
MIRFLLIALLIGFSTNTFANSDTYYDTYPVGYIAENPLYDLMNQNRDKLRQCHQTYLEKIPGAFDSLALEFQVDPQGYAKPLKSEVASSPKDEALNCLKTLIRSLKFPAPVYGIVFVKFESDIDLQNMGTISTQELSRNSVTLVPYVPQKMIASVVEMYMPYYRGCFGKPFVEKKENGKITVKWNVSEDGRPVDIQITSSIDNPKMTQCLTQVTEQHRYPSGYVKTAVERSFSIK